MLSVCRPVSAQPDLSLSEGVARPHGAFVVPEAPEEAKRVATKGKKTLERMVKNNDKHAQDLGFRSAAEAADTNTKLGAAFPRIRVDLNALLDFEPDMDPTTLLVPTGEFIYPVTVDGQVRSSLTVSFLGRDPQTDEVWRTTEWGARGLIRVLDKTRKTAEVSISSFALVIPDLYRYFLGNISGEKFVIIPMYDEPLLGFQAGKPLPAKVVFQKLLPEAKIRTSPKCGRF